MRIKLKDNWLFTTDDGTSKNISIPHNFPLNVRSYPNPAFEHGSYKRVLKEVKNASGKRVFLRFHGVDYHSKIFVNNKQVSEHVNGYDLFEVEITDLLNFDGEDELLVEVSDYDISDHPERIAGKQDWYGNSAGIIQDVELWIVDDLYIKSVRVYPQEDLETVKCFAEFSDGKEHDFEIVVIDPDGIVVFRKNFNKGKFEFKIPNPQLWSTESPNLYSIVVNFKKDKNEDSFQTKFGIRYVKVDNGKLLLNGKPIYIFGTLDQNFYPDTHYSLRDKVKMLSELTKTKDLGMNLLRYHVKIPDDLYLEIADELGILVWIDLPYARELNEDSKAYLEKLLENVLKRHANHPSFIMLSFIYESWGLRLTEDMDEETYEWLFSFYEKAKKMDETRLYVDNSACCGNLHVVSDVDDYHFYHSFPYHNDQWKKKVEKFASGEFRTFLRKPDRKLPKILSEFGVWGLSDPRSWEGDWPNYPVTLMGIPFNGTSPGETIKKVFGFHNLDDFVFQTQLNQFLGLKYQIEAIRLRPEIVGYVITEFSDIAWESNGLLDYNRMPKSFYPYMRFLNSEVLGIIKDHRSILTDSNYSAEIFISNMSSKKLPAKLIVKTEKRVLKATDFIIGPFELVLIGKFDFELEKEEQMVIIEVYNDNFLISRNFYPVIQLEKKEINEDNIVWINEENVSLNDFEVVHEETKAFAHIDWKGDWVSGFTIFNSKRDLNISAILWGLHGLLSKFVLIPKKNVNFNSKNSIISKVIGWGYGLGSLVYVVEENGSKKIFTTLKKSELSKIIISNILS